MNRDAAEYLDYCLRHYAASSRPEAVAAEQRARAAFDVVRAKVAAANLKVTPAGAEVFVQGRCPRRASAARSSRVPPSRTASHRSAPDGARFGRARGQRQAWRNDGGRHRAQASVRNGGRGGKSRRKRGQTEPDAPSESKNYVPAIVTASVGGLALAGGVVFLVMRSGKQSDASDKLDTLDGKNPCGTGLPSENGATCAEIADLSDEAATFGTLSPS